MTAYTVAQARRQALLLIFLGWTVSAACLVLLIVALLKGIYGLAHPSNTQAGVALFASLGRLIDMLYAAAAGAAPGLTKSLWQVAPDLSFRTPFVWADHLGLVGVYVLLLLSLLPRGRATRLRHAIAEHEKRQQQIRWERQARRSMEQSTTQDVQIVPLSIENQKAPWHQRLIGIIVLGIALPLVVEVVKVVVGLAKLP